MAILNDPVPSHGGSNGKRLVNDIPMSNYSSNSGLQHAAMLVAQPLLRQAVSDAFSSPSGQRDSGSLARDAELVRMVEYGSSHGNNSIIPFATLLRELPSGKIKEVEIVCNDRPQNNFSALASNISSLSLPSSPTPTVYPLLSPKSFYNPILPSSSTHLGFSFACLHHLEDVPPMSPAHQGAVGASRLSTLRAQSHKDLVKFLALRAKEFVQNGQLVLSFASQASTGEENYAGGVGACRAALVEMLREGVLGMQAVGAFEVPTYNRSSRDVEGALREVVKRTGEDGENGQIGDKGKGLALWELKEVREERVVHPAVEELERRRSAAKQMIEGKKGTEDGDSDSMWYASTIVDWVMAVVAGYFRKAVESANPSVTEREVDALAEDWTNRTKKHFLQSHRDEETACWFIYVRLRRL
ncbi:hypothetical protein MKZ38_005495 [Zalerion maritima]|uniref:Uncharacterized protein n=1 Tax=Zalerion maritima TaxID=339359 RepID=A0AAD5RW33_9PEZI|nr:hypothetical protein MKZ38_005495 [Zalerion maritima]